ncbi:MAG: alpha/beta hydrolase [Deltaproteobacteria bacterium]|nr:MAG: alpha/beta hydrolase [Deltaproteobacteria bacterium]
MPEGTSTADVSLPRSAVVLLAGAMSVVACTGADEGARRRIPADFASCRLAGGLSAHCGTVRVPLGEGAEPDATLDLAVAIVPASSPTPDALPVYMLAGGPGQASIATYPRLLPMLGDVRRRHDVVLVDQRGTGRSAGMVCDEPEDPARRLDPVPDFAELARCLEGLPLDPRVVTTEHAVADLERVRMALGHDRIALVGASYGTRMALSYMRRHQDRVAAAVLDGVAPPEMVLFEDFATDAQAALDGRLAACAADEACNEAFGDLAHRFSEALADLARAPRTVRAEHPRTGESFEVEASRRIVAPLVRGLLYATDLAPILPYTLHRLAAGDLDPLLGQGLVFADEVEGSMATAMMLSVVCAEDVPFIEPERARAKSEGTFLGTVLVDLLREVCARWPHGEVPPDVKAPVTSDVPVLLLSGQLDPVTPPRWAELAARGLTRSWHVVVPRAGHGTLVAGCVPDLVGEFLAAPGSFAEVDTSCVESFAPLPFFVDAGGPRP